MLTRSGVAKRLGKSIASVRRMEGVELHPVRDERGVHRFDPVEVEQVAGLQADARLGHGGELEELRAELGELRQWEEERSQREWEREQQAERERREKQERERQREEQRQAEQRQRTELEAENTRLREELAAAAELTAARSEFCETVQLLSQRDLERMSDAEQDELAELLEQLQGGSLEDGE